MLDSITNAAQIATTAVAAFSLPTLLLCTLVSLILGLGVAAVYAYKSTYTKSFLITLALLPALVQVVIMLVNGNLGTGVAVMGAFGLVRFRSLPGSAREISAIFFAMALGLATGMCYITYAILFFILIGGAMLLLSQSRFGNHGANERILRITIPEDMDYDGLFDDLFRDFTSSAKLTQVRTTNMGSLYELHYLIRLRSAEVPKAFIDRLRCRNGNLNIICGRVPEKEGL